MKRIALFIATLSILACRTGAQVQSGADTSHFQWTVSQAPEWSSVFIRNQGWLGGDGIFMTTENGNESPGSGLGKPVIMWFSDTELGRVTGDSLSPAGSAMIHNSFGYLPNGRPDAAAARFYWDTAGAAPKPVFVPSTPLNGAEDYFWLADGFVNPERNNDLFLFAQRVADSPGEPGFGFKLTGNTLIRVAANRLLSPAAAQQADLPFFTGLNQDSAGFFGVGVLVNARIAGLKNGDGYAYIYGGRKGSLIVARVRPADIDRFDRWRFWSGKNWSADPRDIASVTDHISNELSMTPLEDGRYLMVFQVDGIAPRVAFRLAASPVGPFGPVETICETTDSLSAAKTLYSYNAKVHPVISKPGELIISYNVNSTDFQNDIRRMPHLYRPRFLRFRYSISR